MAHFGMDYETVKFADFDLLNTPVICVMEMSEGYCYLLDTSKLKRKANVWSSTQGNQNGVWVTEYESVFDFARNELEINMDELKKDMTGEEFVEFVQQNKPADLFDITHGGVQCFTKLSKPLQEGDRLFDVLSGTEDEDSGGGGGGDALDSFYGCLNIY